MAAPMATRTSEPIPRPRVRGSMPAIAARVVITTGRRRSTVPLTAASRVFFGTGTHRSDIA